MKESESVHENGEFDELLEKVTRYLTKKEREKLTELIASSGNDPLQVMIDALHNYLSDDITVAQLQVCLQKASELGMLNNASAGTGISAKPYVTSEHAIKVADEVAQDALEAKSENPFADLMKLLTDSIKQQILAELKGKLQMPMTTQNGNNTGAITQQKKITGDEDVID